MLIEPITQLRHQSEGETGLPVSAMGRTLCVNGDKNKVAVERDRGGDDDDAADQSRYLIWSVQNRSSRVSETFRVPNSSAEMPPICSTVMTCFS